MVSKCLFEEICVIKNTISIASLPEIDHAMKQFVFECMRLTTVDEETGKMILASGDKIIPWDHPYPFYKDMVTEEPVENHEVSSEDPSEGSGKKNIR